jgi:hypothetical protein
VFVEETMVELAQLGRELGRDPASWRTRVPDPESPFPEEPAPDDANPENAAPAPAEKP